MESKERFVSLTKYRTPFSMLHRFCIRLYIKSLHFPQLHKNPQSDSNKYLTVNTAYIFAVRTFPRH